MVVNGQVSRLRSWNAAPFIVLKEQLDVDFCCVKHAGGAIRFVPLSSCISVLELKAIGQTFIGRSFHEAQKMIRWNEFLADWDSLSRRYVAWTSRLIG